MVGSTSVHIDTYNPLFITPKNKTGRVCLPQNEVALLIAHSNASPANPLSPEEVAAMQKEQAGGADLYYTQYEKKNGRNKGGLLGELTDQLVAHTNFPPNSAPALKSAMKIGALIGL